MSSNDNELTEQALSIDSGESHGRAALLLVESLIHELCASKILSLGQAVAIADCAAEVQLNSIDDTEGDMAPSRRARSLLLNISASLAVDLPT